MHLHTAIITLLTVLLLAVAMSLVSRARGKFKVAAPAVTGPAGFERTFRAHQNTLEQAVMFLPTLWVASAFGNEAWTTGLGYGWVLSRLWYLVAYVSEGGRRGTPFTLAILIVVALWIVGLLGIWPLLTA